MSKTSIAIIIVCTAIIAAVVFFTINEEPGIKDIYLLSSSNISEDSLRDRGMTDFHSNDPGIYLVIPVTGVKSGDTLHVEWVYISENGDEIAQRDDIGIEEDGSGNIVVYLLKRDSAYKPGDYIVKLKYNGIQIKEASFSITGSHVSSP